MEINRVENNQVTLSGEIVSNFEFSHEVFGEGFYKSYLKSDRKSGVSDIIPIMVSERLMHVKEKWAGQIACMYGQYRSYNRHEENINHLELSVFVRDIETWEDEDENKILLTGCICREPIYRKTPLGREIANLLLAVNRPYGKSDYIPCIAWGRNARFASSLEVGTQVHLEGRIQSREYLKKMPYGETEKRTAYEVSVAKIETIEEQVC